MFWLPLSSFDEFLIVQQQPDPDHPVCALRQRSGRSGEVDLPIGEDEPVEEGRNSGEEEPSLGQVRSPLHDKDNVWRCLQRDGG